MKPSKTDTALLTMLRQKQQRLGIKYLTTDSSLYKFFAVIFYIAFFWTVIMSLLFIISTSAQLNVNISYIEDFNGLQKEQIPAMRNSIYSALVFTLLLIPSPFLLKAEKNILNLIFSILPSAVLIFTFYGAMSENVDGGIVMPFLVRHFIPLTLIIISAVICGIIAIRQHKKDADGTAEIAEKIYNRYNLLADNITDEQWQEILSEYGEAVRKKKHRRKQNLPNTEEKEEIKTEV